MMNQLWLPKTRARIVYLFTQLKLPTKYYKKIVSLFSVYYHKVTQEKKCTDLCAKRHENQRHCSLKFLLPPIHGKKTHSEESGIPACLPIKIIPMKDVVLFIFLDWKSLLKGYYLGQDFLFSRWENLNRFKDQIICFRLGFSRIL